MEKTEKEKNNRWSPILLIINLFIWTIILIIWFIFNGVVHALTPVEANFTYDNNGTATSYNIKPDGGTTGFIYNNEFFGQEINHSSYRYYKLPGSTLTTTNINGYFQNPCQSNEEMSYTMTINFYKQSTSTNTMSGVSVINGINGCSGYLSQLPDSVVYYNVCTIQPGDVPKFSLYFSESSSGMTTYRVGIPTNFSYTCQVGNQAVIDNATANANNIINNIQQTTDNIINQTTQAINSANEYCSTKKTIIKPIAMTNRNGTSVSYRALTNNMDISNLSEITIKTNIDLTTYEWAINTAAVEFPNTATMYDTGWLTTDTYTFTKTTGHNYLAVVIRKKTNGNFTLNDISNVEFYREETYCTSNTQAIIDANGNYFSELNSAINQGLDASYVPVEVDGTKLDDLEDIETELHTYTNVDLEAMNVNLDPDTGSWVWNTLTRLLNANSLVFGMVISILSLGIIKLILNR